MCLCVLPTSCCCTVHNVNVWKCARVFRRIRNNETTYIERFCDDNCFWLSNRYSVKWNFFNFFSNLFPFFVLHQQHNRRFSWNPYESQMIFQKLMHNYFHFEFRIRKMFFFRTWKTIWAWMEIGVWGRHMWRVKHSTSSYLVVSHTNRPTLSFYGFTYAVFLFPMQYWTLSASIVSSVGWNISSQFVSSPNSTFTLFCFPQIRICI